MADLLRLVERADVLVEAYRPGVAERLGLRPGGVPGPQPPTGVRADDRLGPARPAGARAGHDIDYIAVAGALEPLGRAGERPHAPLEPDR